MSNVISTANMNLVLPIPGVDPGPDYAYNVNASFQTVDGHDHSFGKGVQITPAGININADLAINQNNITFIRSLRFFPQVSPIAGASDVGCLYAAGVDLWFNDVSGNQIQITQNGGVAGTPGSISNLTPPASAAYVSAQAAFVWQSNVNKPANMDFASATFRNFTTNSKGLTLFPPAAMPADYQLVLPVLPGANGNFVTINTDGSMGSVVSVDNNTIKIISNQLVAQPDALGEEEHSWELNGNYPVLTYPLSNIDSVFFAPFNLTIRSVWIYNGDAGSSGTTEYDLKVASPGGSFATILSTTGQITSAAAGTIWSDSGTVIGAQTGVTKPVISNASINAGQAIRFDLIQSMTGAATDARIRIFYTKN